MVRKWINNLKSPDISVRQQASESLRALGPEAREAVPALVAALKETQGQPDQDYLRQSLASALGAIGPDAGPAVCVLASLVDPDGSWGWDFISEAILRIGGDARDEQLAVRSLLVRDAKCVGRLFLDHELMKQLPDRIMPALASLLTDPLEKCRTRAAEGLGDYGPLAARYVPALVATLKDQAFVPRIQAALSLVAIEPGRKAEAIEALLPLLPSPDATPSVCAALGKLGALAVEPVLALLRQHTGAAQMPYILALQAIGAPGVPALRQELRGPSVAGRVGAARTLELLGQEAQPASEDLVTALEDADAELRRWSAHALVRVDPAHAAPAVPHLITDLESTDAAIRTEAATLLALLGRTALPAVSALRKALEDSEVRLEAARALVEIDAAQAADAVPVLMDALERVRENVPPGYPSEYVLLTTLGRIGPAAAQAVPVIRQSLHSSQGDVRCCAAQALVRVAPEFTAEAADALMAALEDPALAWDPNTFFVAVEALAEIGPGARDIVDRLKVVLLDDEKRRMWDPTLLFSTLVKIDPAEADLLLAQVEAELQAPGRLDKPVGFLTDIATEVPEKAALLLSRLLADRRAEGLHDSIRTTLERLGVPSEG